MPNSLSDQAHAEVTRIAQETPSAFTVGGSFDGKKVVGGFTVDRKWSNGWGLTAYARAWWDDAAVTPHKSGAEAGFQATKTFK